MKVLVLNPGSKQTKNVVRDLIYGCWCRGKRIGGMQAPPINLVYVATIIKELGHDVKFVDALIEGKPIEEFTKIIKKQNTLIICTSTMSFKEDCRTLAKCKEINPYLKTIIFGSHPTFMPNECNVPEVDFIVRKEPEFIIKNLIRALSMGNHSYQSVKGIGYKKGKELILTEDAEFEDLNNLPIPDRSFLSKDIDYFNPLVKKIPYTTMMTSRGCPALCTFCTVPTFFGNKIRARTAELVLQELEMIMELGYKEVWIRDETFTVYKKRNKIICEEMIKRKLNLSWFCNARAGTVTKEEMQLMKDAGCHMIKFGVESGVQEILDNVKKGIKIEQTMESFQYAHEVGMDTHAHVMLGMPGDTLDTIKETIKFVIKIDPTTASFGICTPYAGTPMFKEILEKHPELGDGSNCDLSKLHETNFFNEYITDIEPQELEKYIKKAYKIFYIRPSYILKWLKRISSISELRRLTIAGSNVFSFSFEKR